MVHPDQNTNKSLPPSYDVASSTSSDAAGPATASYGYPADVKAPLLPTEPRPQIAATAVASHTLIAPPIYSETSSNTGVSVYYYQNPVTGESITSLLPPDHPEMVCLTQGHVQTTKFGLLGIAVAVFWFPLGLAAMFFDRKVKCTRCGKVLSEAGCS